MICPCGCLLSELWSERVSGVAVHRLSCPACGRYERKFFVDGVWTKVDPKKAEDEPCDCQSALEAV